MTVPPDLSRLVPGDRVQDLFLVLEVETRTGDHPHTVLTLGNASGSISTAPFWAEEGSTVAGLGRWAVVRVVGEVASYRQRRQLRVSSIQLAPECGIHGHVVLGAMMLDRTVRGCAAPPCDDRELAILIHLVLSHHGRREFGAPVFPMTLEAEVIHHADNASARTASMRDAIRTEANFSEGGLVSTAGFWQLDRRRVYRGSSDWGA